MVAFGLIFDFFEAVWTCGIVSTTRRQRRTKPVLKRGSFWSNNATNISVDLEAPPPSQDGGGGVPGGGEAGKGEGMECVGRWWRV